MDAASAKTTSPTTDDNIRCTRVDDIHDILVNVASMIHSCELQSRLFRGAAF